MIKEYDVIVIGGGHAGIEACYASARLNVKTLLVTENINKIGELSCNPSIGGIGKGTVVKEIDALGGVMGVATDFASINRKILNASKGAAVWGPRHQIDRIFYKKKVKEILNLQKNLEILEAEVIQLKFANGKIYAIEIKTKETVEEIKCKACILTTGTFLNGTIIIGDERYSAGRINEFSSISLAESIKDTELSISRLKTGTPCRLKKNTINYAGLSIQKSEINSPYMSFIHENSEDFNEKLPQIDCHITYTNLKSHAIILENFHRIPSVNGTINFKGPRYCPSIEDKLRRFSDRERHQIFLETEGIESDLIYPAGISTSMPKDLQDQFIASIEGLENAEIIQYGYAIEYDFVDPREVYHSLETKKIQGLYLAGQIIGTTGYEEAGGLGIVAGLNAALKTQEKDAFILNRSSGFIGILIDDIVTLGIDGEPYRLFTSRSEYRLSSRSDNADFRLTPLAIELGIIDENRRKIFEKKLQNFQIFCENLKKLSISNIDLLNLGFIVKKDGIAKNAFELLQFFSWQEIEKIWPEIIKWNISNVLKFLIDTEAKYSPYLERQSEEIKKLEQNEKIKIPKDFNFKIIGGLSKEVIEKLNIIQPSDLSQASRIPGITPTSILAIMVELNKRK